MGAQSQEREEQEGRGEADWLLTRRRRESSGSQAYALGGGFNGPLSYSPTLSR